MPLLRAGYKTLHYTDWVPSSNSAPHYTLIFTHGLGSSQNFYLPIVPGLLELNYRCITFDTTGAARSPYTQVEQSVETLGQDILWVLDALKVEKAIVVGHSMGGLVAASLAATASKRVAALILLAPVDPSPAIAAAFEKRIALVEEKGMNPLADSIPVGATAKSASPLARAFVRELLLGQTPVGYISNCRVIATAKSPQYREIQCPVLVAVGDEDQVVPITKGKELYEELGAKAKRWVELKECGHWPVLERPEQVQQAVVEFLDQVAALS